MDLTKTLTADTPPDGLSPPAQALWWLAHGGWRTGPDWTRAHEICQQDEGDAAHDWVHALCHWIEGDQGNSNYWYRRAGQQRQSTDTRTEWAHIAAALA